MCQTVKYVFILLAGCFLQIDCKPRDLYVGSKCHNSKAPGRCTLATNCTPALEAIKNKGRHDLKRCGFDGFNEIVCCPATEIRHITPDPSDAKTKGVEVPRRSVKACDAYSKDLPIVLSYHIVGGENAELGEFPHMAALGFFNNADKIYRFDCGGTLISNKYIVTAAHCIINIEENVLKIARLGVIQVPGSVAQSDPTMDYNVVNITVHKDYNWKEKLNDIALVKLEKEVNFTENIRPACLYSKNDDPQRLMVTGWGATTLGGEKSTILQKATLSPVSLTECNVTYYTRTNRHVTNAQMCAANSSSDACQGDSGGPLQTQSTSSILSIVGVTSYGIGCGSKYPGIYTRISSYLDWIEEYVWP